VRGRAERIDGNEIVLDGDRRVPFDRAVVATGSRIARTTPGAADHADVLEPATLATMREKLLRSRRVLVLGGGLTGVEVAAEIAESMPDRQVTLVTRALAPALTPGARAHVEKVLARLRVEVVLDTVERIEAGVAQTGARALAFDLAIDTLGFASAAPRFLGGARDAQGRVVTDASLVSRDRADLVLAGDLAAPEGTLAGAPMIRGCQSAMPMGAHAADVAFQSARGEAPRPFAFTPNGFCVSLGRRDGVIDAMGMVLTGRLAVLVKESVCRYTIASMAWQARGWDYRWRPFFGSPRRALPAPAAALRETTA
jgi:NADH dehydrogenase FAD-containing subunit